MREITKLNPWAEAGTKIPVPLAKIDSGWLDGEQPPFEYENHRRFEVDSKTNEVIDRLNRIQEPTRALVPNISTMELGLDVGFPDSLGNVISPDVPGFNIVGSCAAVIDDVPFIFSLESRYTYLLEETRVNKTNVETGVKVNLYTNTQTNLTGLSIACDGESLFILERWGTGSTRVFHLTALSVLDGSPVPGWVEPSMGEHIPAAVVLFPYILRVLPSGNLFLGGNWKGTGTSRVYVVNPATGQIISAGNPGMTGDVYPCGSAISFEDGQILFTTVNEVTGARTVMGCTETLTPVSGFPITSLVASPTYFNPACIFRIDSERWGWISNRDDNSTPPRMNVVTKDLSAPDDYYTVNTSFDFGNESKVDGAWFDGFNLWVVVYLHTWKGETPGGVALVRLNLSALPMWLGSGRGFNLSNYINSSDVFFLNHASELTPAPIFINGHLTFDGSAIWVGTDAGEGKKLYRVNR